jgi:coenzyme F420-reducing hydrogenase delta subunit
MSNDNLSRHQTAGEAPPAATAFAEDVLAVQETERAVSRTITLFRCVNCSRTSLLPPPAIESPSSQPEPDRLIEVHEVALPCTGRLQPEHLLKALEAGADLVCVVACAKSDCHHLEGNRRAERRIGYVEKLLDEIGLGGERLMLFHLAGSTQGNPTPGHVPERPSLRNKLNQDESASDLAAAGEMATARLGALSPNPLRGNRAAV